MKRPALLLALLLAAALPTACVQPRLDGPDHGADGPPWIAQDLAGTVAPFEVEQRIVLIGDAGLYLEDDPVLASLRTWTADVPSTVVFLGDNLYDEGLQPDDRDRGEKILRQQVEATDALRVFVPGNHDWGLSPNGQDPAVVGNQQAYLEGFEGVRFAPAQGCMGPAELVLPGRAAGRAVVLVLADPTKWIYPALETRCARTETHDGFLAELDGLLTRHADDWVVMGSHYPMETGGPHGGLSYGRIGDMVLAFYAWRYGGLGNTYEPDYADWIARTTEVMRRHPPTLYAAGHDHSLQILDGHGYARMEVVSGAGAVDRVSTVTDLPASKFAHAAPGFVLLDLGLRDGEPVAALRVVEGSATAPVFEIGID